MAGYLTGGKWITEGGKAATSSGCCCGSVCPCASALDTMEVQYKATFYDWLSESTLAVTVTLPETSRVVTGVGTEGCKIHFEGGTYAGDCFEWYCAGIANWVITKLYLEDFYADLWWTGGNVRYRCGFEWAYGQKRELSAMCPTTVPYPSGVGVFSNGHRDIAILPNTTITSGCGTYPLTVTATSTDAGNGAIYPDWTTINQDCTGDLIEYDVTHELIFREA